MTRKEINELYEESVFQIRLRVAINFAALPDLSFAQALQHADEFVSTLMAENAEDLKRKFP